MTDISLDPIAPLRTALAIAAEVVAIIADDQWALPTPCTDWDVARLVAHLHDGDTACAAALGSPGADLADAFAAPGALDRLVDLPFGQVPGAIALHLRTVESLVHAWDLAVATGQSVSAPPDLVEPEIEFSRMALQMLPDDATPFAASVDVPDTASPVDRLAALLGRRVAESAPMT